jgi:hypothetical protein
MRLPRLPEFTPRFTPHEQAVAILLAHGLIVIVVTAIMLLGVKEAPPWQFLAGEGLILALCVSIIGKFEGVADFRYFRGAKDPIRRFFEDWRQDGPPLVFAVAFVLQFVALTPVLMETGGPMDSPFGQLALAFAVFPPILANRLMTMLIALISSILYIAIMVMMHSEVSSSAPGKGVFIAVSGLVLVASVGLAILDRWDHDNDRKPLPQADGRTAVTSS